MKKKRILFGEFALLLFLLLIGCGIYVNDYYKADETAITALQSDNEVTVIHEDNIYLFSPDGVPAAGFIFYPGGKVEAAAYAPLMHALAEKDILCVLMEMPFNLAVLDIDAAEGIWEKYPEVEEWYIGGHSLGGSIAASFAAKHPDVIQGLVLLAAYSTADLQSTDLDVISIFGSMDTVLNMEKYAQYWPNLPMETTEVVIEGGCHSYFGSYGRQSGDGIPAITVQEQLQITAQQLETFLK